MLDLSYDDARALSYAIISVWSVGFVFRVLVRSLRSRDSDQDL